MSAKKTAPEAADGAQDHLRHGHDGQTDNRDHRHESHEGKGGRDGGQGRDDGKKKSEEIKVPRTQTNAALLTQLDQRMAFRRARGNGPSHSGAATFILQRLTAVALVPLAVWFVASLVTAMTGTGEPAAAWLARPINLALLAALILVALRHATIGVQVILEDYVHTTAALTVSKLLLYGIALATALATVVGLAAILFKSVTGA